MPSRHDCPADAASRRRVLSGVGTAFAGALAGCSGRVPGTGATDVDAVSTADPNSLLWEYPRTDGPGIGYAQVSFDRLVRREGLPPALRLELNSTVDLGSGNSGDEYSQDWFRFRIGPPNSYEGRDAFEVRVQPPGQWEAFSTYYDRQGGRRQFVVELQEADTRGTVIVPAVFDPVTDVLPDRLHCSVVVQASRPGALGKTIRVEDRGTLSLDVD